MSKSFKLPDLGEGVHEAEILAVHVTTGQHIEEGEVLLEVETDKAAVEIPSPVTGTVGKITVKSGDFAKVGDILIFFDQESAAETLSESSDFPPSKTLPVPASPSTRRLARELGVDLSKITPSGSSGIVTREDVQKLASSPPPEESTRQTGKEDKKTVVTGNQNRPSSKLPDFSRWGPVERLPFRSIRRATARHMTTSWSQIPHVYCQDTVDITKLEQFRQNHRQEIADMGGRLTLTVFALKAVVIGLKNFPCFNASLDTESQEIILKRYFHIGVAVDSKAGLTVPVIRDVDRKSIKEVAIELNESIKRIKAGQRSREEMIGSTFTISNAGALGGDVFTAIINHPEVAILGLGEGRMRPTVVTDEKGEHKILPRLIMPIVLGFDHRVVDGADAIRFLKLIRTALEDPDELLITMI